MSGDIYNECAPQLIAGGYFPLPIAPGTKAPHRYIPSEQRFELLSGWQERPEPILTPQPGAGISVRCGNGLVAIDYDDDDAALKVSEALGGSPIGKAGKRAWTDFYYADFEVVSENVTDADGVLMLQILSAGRQTVIPPSIHMDTGEPYRYHNGRSLTDTPKTELPPLPRDFRERILALGYLAPGVKDAKPQQQTEEPRHQEAADDEGPFQALNRLALKDLVAWVPALDLYRCHRRPGPHASYEAVATWRPSTTGNPPEKRKLNLKISGKHGIKDFGDGRGYSPIDLAMAARPCSLAEAYDWLRERVGPRGPDIDFEAIGSEDFEDAEPKTEGAEKPPKNQQKQEKKGRIALLRYDAPDPTTIPRRAWLYGFHYMRKIVSATVGPGGIGK